MDPKLEGARVVLSLSGGKDSAAASLYLKELGVEHERVFMDTGWESDDTYRYIDEVLEPHLGPVVRIESAKFPGGMLPLLRHKAMFPSRLRRFCTSELKVLPIVKYMNAIEDGGESVVNVIGIRAAESSARANLPEWEVMDGQDIDIWRPILRWTTDQVIEIHKRHGLAPNPMYLKGASRVGCWPCVFARKREIRLLADLDPKRVDVIRQLEIELTEEARNRSEAKGEPLNYPRTFFHSHTIGKRNELPVNIDTVIEWARTGHGGKQLLLIETEPPGCVRWGMCEANVEDDDE